MRLEIIKDAYRKLKGSVYYDKTLAFIRARIAEYEKNDIDAKLNEFYTNLKSASKWENVETSILNSVRVLTFPKNIDYLEEHEDESPIVVSNIQANHTIIDKYNNFIDMEIEGFLVGILWVVCVGYLIDNNLSETCYGNRLRDNLVFKKGEITSSPNLFKPYFEQYEIWRNMGLEKAKKCLEKKQNVIITMLDLSRYYYNTDLTENLFNKLTQADTLNAINQRINRTVYNIIAKYSKMCGIEHTFLPIGFHPSNILANIYLTKLDDSFKQISETVYYGRYVDDIMWIKSVQGEVASRIQDQGSHVVADMIIDELLNNNILKRKNDSYLLCGEKYLAFKKEKFRFFYLDYNGSKDLLLKIKKDIKQNTSEFNYIPEEYASDFNPNLYKIERDDTVNKIRGVKSAVLDKYSLSKNIGKSVLMSAFTDEEQVEDFIDSLSQILDGREIISNYLLWESILNYFIISGKITQTVDFTVKIVEALNQTDEDTKKVGDYAYLESNRNVVGVKDSLLLFYWACLGRSFSLTWGEKILPILNEIVIIMNSLSKHEFFCFDNILLLRKEFIYSRMCNKGVLPVTMKHIMNTFEFEDIGETCNLTNLDSLIDKHNDNAIFEEYKYLPYVDSPFEIGFSHLIDQIRKGRDSLEKPDEYVKYIKEEYRKNFPGLNKDLLSSVLDKVQGDSYYISVTTQKKTTIKTAIANVRMYQKDIEDILDRKQKSKRIRAKEIADLTNVAIKNNADVLVLPEAYVPIQCLRLLGKKSASKQMLINCGIEHIVARGQVWNLTCILIPFEINKVRYSIPFFRQKKFFAPDEKKNITDRGLHIPLSTPNALFGWHGIRFATYCCYELTAILDRAEYIRKAEIIYGIEWNRDVKYYSNIMESLSRDMYCYCIQANMSEYGDSRIVAPAHSYYKDILQVKGGENAIVLIGSVDLEKLRIAKKSLLGRKKNHFAELPAGLE